MNPPHFIKSHLNALPTSNKRKSEWFSLKRALCILRRLEQGVASRDVLIAAVRQAMGADAYPDTDTATNAAFKRDRAHLASELGVKFSFDQRKQVYMLNDPGVFGYLQFSMDGLAGLQVISRSFYDSLGEQAQVRILLDELLNRLDPALRQALETQRTFVEIELESGVETNPISPNIFKVLNQAIAQQRRLSFNYLSPSHADQQTRYHEVAALRLRFQRGHWYLGAYDLYWRNPAGEDMYGNDYRLFRLTNIIDDTTLKVMSQKLPSQPAPPRYLVHYRLLPTTARSGVSKRFSDMSVLMLPDGVAEVQGYTEEPWLAAQTLLMYGENCVVLGGPEVLVRVRQAVQGMARHYDR